MSLLAPIKRRSQCYTSLHYDKYGYLRTWHMNKLEYKQNIMPDNVDTQCV